MSVISDIRIAHFYTVTGENEAGVDPERLPLVWKTRKFRGEFKWSGSSRWKFSGKKSNTFRGITFSPFLPKFSVPFVWIISARLHVERKWKIDRYFVNGTTQSRSCFQCAIIPVPFDGNFSRNFRTNGKRSLFWYNPSCFVMQIMFLCYKLEFSKHNFHKKRKEVCIKTRSTSSSRLLKGSNSKPLSVK